MASPTRGILKIGLGAGALYFLVMRNLPVAAEWYNERCVRLKPVCAQRALGMVKGGIRSPVSWLSVERGYVVSAGTFTR